MIKNRVNDILKKKIVQENRQLFLMVLTFLFLILTSTLAPRYLLSTSGVLLLVISIFIIILSLVAQIKKKDLSFLKIMAFAFVTYIDINFIYILYFCFVLFDSMDIAEEKIDVIFFAALIPLVASHFGSSLAVYEKGIFYFICFYTFLKYQNKYTLMLVLGFNLGARDIVGQSEQAVFYVVCCSYYIAEHIFPGFLFEIPFIRRRLMNLKQKKPWSISLKRSIHV